MDPGAVPSCAGCLGPDHLAAAVPEDDRHRCR
nr:hypothetical protein [Nocardia puris]